MLYNVCPDMDKINSSLQYAGARFFMVADARLQQIIGKLRMPELVFGDERGDLPQDRLFGLPRSPQEEIGGKMFADHVPRQFAQRVSNAVVNAVCPHLDQVAIGQRTITNHLKIAIQHIEMFVRFIKLYGKYSGKVNLVPARAKQVGGVERKVRLDQSRVANLLQQFRLGQRRFRTDVVPGNIGLQYPSL